MEERKFVFGYLGHILGVILICIFLSACQDDNPDELAKGTETRSAESVPVPGTRVLPTIYPTRTALPTLLPTDTVPPLPTDVPNTPIAFDQTVVELSYAIPSIGLERSMRANVSSVLELNDEATGEAVTLRDQIGVIYELQQSLPELNLASLPEDCPNCVQFSYSLPLADLRDQGWLTDTQILASLENYTAANLRPHFPADTVLGFRRSATPYHAAHTLALTSDGTLWYWSAIDGEVPDPISDAEFVDRTRSVLAEFDLEDLSDAYSAPCPAGSGLETLYIDSEPDSKQIRFVCPELSLPASLLPLYLGINDKIEDLIPDIDEDQPAKAIPLNSLVHFRSSDGSQMSLLNDGIVSLTDSDGIVYTQTVTLTNIISLTAVLLEDENLNNDAAAFDEIVSNNLLFVRGPDGVFSLAWLEGERPLNRESLDLVEKLLEELLERSISTEEVDEDESAAITPSPTPNETPEP